MVTSPAPGSPEARCGPCGGRRGLHTQPRRSHSESVLDTGAGPGTAVGNGDSSSDCNPPVSTAAVVVAVDSSPRGNVVAEDGKDVDSAVDCRLFSLPPPELRPPKT